MEYDTETRGKWQDRAQVEIAYERARQVKRWMDEPELLSRYPDWRSYMAHKMLVLTEEVGETSKEVLEYNQQNALEEMIQVAAVAQAMVEGLIEINGGWSPTQSG